MRLLLLLVSASALAQTPTPQWPEAIQVKMTAADQKIDVAREKFSEWRRAHPTRPNPGYATAVEFRHKEFIAAQETAAEAIASVADEERALPPNQQKALFGWVKKATKRLPCRNSKPRRTHRVRLFYFSHYFPFANPNESSPVDDFASAPAPGCGSAVFNLPFVFSYSATCFSSSSINRFACFGLKP